MSLCFLRFMAASYIRTFISSPFILTIIVAYFLKFRKSIFYYLIIIDGLMVIKAFFGIMTNLLF